MLLSPRESTQSGNSFTPRSGASPPASAPTRPVVAYRAPAEAAPSASSPAATAPAIAPAIARAPAATHPSHTRLGRERADASRATVRRPHHASPALVGATVLAPASSNRHGLLLLLASLASALLVFSGLGLLRLLKRLDASPHLGSPP
jgi:hypothetical protein